MEKAHEIVKQHIDKSQVKQKLHYDKKAKAVGITVGDKVLVRKFAFEGKHKIQDKFETDAYRVVEQPRLDIPVFRIKSELTGNEKTLHRNHLLLMNLQSDIVECSDESQTDPNEKNDEVTRDASNEIDVEETCDVTIEEDDLDNDGEPYAADVYKCGDAHNPENVRSPRESRQETARIKSSVEDVSSSEDSDTDCEFEIVDEVKKKSSSLSELIHEIEDPVTESQPRRVLEENTTEDKEEQQEETSTVFVPEEPSEQLQIKVKYRDKEGSEETIDKDEVIKPPERVQDEWVRPENIEVYDEREKDSSVVKPKPLPRRSTRQAKRPEKFDEFVMFQMVNRPIDNRLQALSVLVKSGVLNEMDSGTAHAMVRSIMQ